MSNTQENDRTIFIFRLLIGHNQIGDTIISQNLVIGSDVMRLKMVTYQELGGPGKGPLVYRSPPTVVGLKRYSEIL